MAELGNLFAGAAVAAKDFKVEVEMLDYSYVNECNDWNKLSAIVDVLKSGKEGHYPDLIRVAEEKLVSVLPPKEKKRYLSLSHKTTPSEITEAENELLNWNKAVAEKDATLLHAHREGPGQQLGMLPPVRGSEVQSGKNSAAKASKTAADSEEVGGSQQADILALLNPSQGKKFERLRAELQVSQLSEVKCLYRADLEKTKGNESFRVADNQDALACYSRSLAFNPRSAVVWANRAMAYIRLELFDLAEADASVALLLDPRYVKAYSRRGLVRFKRGKYAQAVADFQEALLLEPGNAELGKLLQTARDKFQEVEGVTVEQAAMAAAALPISAALLLDVETVATAPELLLPPLAGRAAQQQAPSGFVRISVVSDEDEDSDSEESGDQQGEGQQQLHGAGGAFSRVAIVDESESESEGEGEGEEGGERQDQAERAEAHKERGNQLLKAGKAQDAVQAYSECLRLLPGYAPALNNRAQAHLVLKDYPAAIADCSAVLTLEPSNAKALWRRASATVSDVGASAELRAQAGRDLRSLLAAEPNNVAAQQLLAQLEPAAAPAPQPTLAQPAPATAPATLDVQKLKQRAQQLLGDGLNDKVIALLGQYLRTVDEPPFSELLQSDRTSLLHLLATAYASIADYEHAVAVQDAIVTIDPTNFRALYKRAEAQLLIAGQAQGQRRAEALVVAERDIEAALQAPSGSSAEVLALRQKLLRMRNTAPPAPSTPAPAAATSTSNTTAATGSAPESSSSRQQSDMQKEQGNKAMADKHYLNAVQHYDVAIKFDSSNLAAFNNRALAHIKLGQHSQAEADASAVIEGAARPPCSGDTAEVLGALRLKALHRRAQARRALGEAALSALPRPDLRRCEELLVAATADLQELLKADASNKAALTELKQVKDTLKKCEGARTPIATVTSAAPLPVPPPSSRAQAEGGAAQPPRADMQRVSALLSSRGSAPAPSSPSAFGDLGMVARSSKRVGAGATTAAPASPAQSTAAAASVSTPPPTAPARPDSAARAQPASPSPSLAMTAAPAEQPKTVYEFERVWRALKGRPDLFAQYVCSFKKSTHKKVLKEALSPDLLSFMWRSVRDHAPSPDAQLKVLAGFSGAPSFSLSLSLLPAEDLRCVADILASARTHAEALPASSAEGQQGRDKMLDLVAEMQGLYKLA